MPFSINLYPNGLGEASTSMLPVRCLGLGLFGCCFFPNSLLLANEKNIIKLLILYYEWDNINFYQYFEIAIVLILNGQEVG